MTKPVSHQSENAGNAGDVLKHAVLAWTLHHLVERGQVLRYVETHAGAGRYRVPSNDEARGYLFAEVPDDDGSPCAPYARVLGDLTVRDSPTTIMYPGSPLIALEILGAERPHGAAFFETRDDSFASLRRLVPDCHFVGRSAVTEVDNPFPFESHVRGIPFVLCDPFGYRPSDPESSLLEGRLTRMALGRVVQWTRELAADEGSALVMVWTHDNARELLADLQKLGQAAFGRVSVMRADVRRCGILTRYHLAVMAAGNLRAHLVHVMPQTEAWAKSLLLRQWQLQIEVSVG